MNRRSNTLLSAGTIIIVVTIIVSCLCIKDWSGLTPLGMAFMVWAELALFGGLILVEKISENTEQTMLRASYLVILPVYSTCAFIVSAVFIIWLKDWIIAFIIVHLILAAIAAILLIVFSTASKSVYSSNVKTINATNQIGNYVSRLAALVTIMGNSEYIPAVKKAAENLRFTDTSTVVQVDYDIENIISDLEVEFSKETTSQSIDIIKGKITQLNSLIAKRKIETATVKKGGF